MDLISRPSCVRKARHTVRAMHSYEKLPWLFYSWKSQQSFSNLYSLFYNNLSAVAKSLLRLPQSTWTVDDLKEYAIDPRTLTEDHRRGCYMLAAIGDEDDEEVVELYIGSGGDMLKRYRSHVSRINNSNLTDDKIQYFHRRCRELGVTQPLFIRLINEPTQDGMALVFQESVCMAIMGTWGAKGVPQHRFGTWKAVRRMRLADEHDQLPHGWHGANREIPFHPTGGFNSALLSPQK